MSQLRFRRAAAVLTIACVCLAAPAAAGSQAPAKIDVTGAWAFEVQTEAGSGTPLVTFTQDGEKLTGRYSSAVLGEADLTGTVKGREIVFSLTASVQGNSIELTFTGIIEDNAAMKGKVSFGGFGEGTFAGKRK